MLLLLVRIARPRFSIMGRVPLYTKKNPSAEGENNEPDKFVYVPVDHESVKSRDGILPMPPGVVVIRLGIYYIH